MLGSVPLIAEGALPEWADWLTRISRAFVEDLDLAGGETRARLRPSFVVVHQTWLRLCIAHRPEDIPQVLAALQGREMAALMLQELEARQAEYPDKAL